MNRCLLVAFVFILASCVFDEENKEIIKKEASIKADEKKLSILERAQNISDTEPEEAIQLVEEVLLEAQKKDDFVTQAKAYRLRGQLYGAKNYYDQAILDYLKGLELFEKANDLFGQCRCTNAVGYYYLKLEMLDEASKWLKRSEALCAMSKNGMLQYLNYSNQGENYVLNKEYNQAIAKYKQALKVSLALNDPDMIASSYLSLSFAYFEAKDLVEGSKYVEQTLAVAIPHNFSKWIAGAKNNIAYYVHFLPGQYKEAIAVYKEALTYAQDNDVKLKILHGLILAQMYLHHHAEAEKYFNEALALARKLNLLEQQAEAYHMMALGYSSGGDNASFQKAFQYQDEASKLLQEASREKLRQTERALQATMERMISAHQNFLKRQSEEAELRVRSWTKSFAIALLLFGIILAIILLVNVGLRRYVQHTGDLMEYSADALKQVSHKDAIVKQIASRHHQQHKFIESKSRSPLFGLLYMLQRWRKTSKRNE